MDAVPWQAFQRLGLKEVAVCCTEDEQFFALARMDCELLGDKRSIEGMEQIVKMVRNGDKWPYALRYVMDRTGRPNRVGWCDVGWYRRHGITVVDFCELFPNSCDQTVNLPDVSGLLGGEL